MRKSLIHRAILGVWLLGFGPSVLAATNTWVGQLGDDWFTAANWDQNRVPVQEDVVVISAAWVNLNSNAVFARLELRDDARVIGDLELRTVVDVYFGDIVGSLTISSNGVLNLIGPVSSPSLGGPCFNAGRVIVGPGLTHTWTWSSTWHNLPGGLLQFEGGGEIYGFGGPLINSGTIRKTGSAARTVLDIEVINNNGTIEIESGSLEFLVGLASSGSLSIADTAAAVARGGIYDLAQGHDVIGNGAFVINGNIEFQGALHDRLSWIDGTLGGRLLIATNGVLNVDERLFNLLPGTTITNHGIVAFRYPDIYSHWGPGVIWHNAASGLWDIQDSAQVLDGSRIINAGTIRSRGATRRVEFYPLLENYGRLEVEEGYWMLHGLLSDGHVSVSSNASVAVIDGTLALRPNHTVSGLGSFGFNHDTISAEIEDWVYSRLDWSSGPVRGNIRIHSNAVVNFVRPYDNTHALEPLSTFTNYGTVNLFLTGLDGRWVWAEDVVFHNASSGIMQIGTMYSLGGGNRVTLRNEGIIRTTGTGTTQFDLLFTNAALFEHRNGVARFVFGFAQTPAGSLAVRLSLPDAALLVDGIAQLAGHLAIDVAPDLELPLGAMFQIMTFGDRVGSFQTFSGLGIAPGLRFDVLHQPTDVSLQVVAPENRLSRARLSGDDFTFTFDGDADRLYEVQASTNLTHWHVLYTTNSQTGIFSLRDTAVALFRQRFYKLRAAGP